MANTRGARGAPMPHATAAGAMAPAAPAAESAKDEQDSALQDVAVVGVPNPQQAAGDAAVADPVPSGLYPRIAWVMRQVVAVPKRGTNPHFRYQYATAADVVELIGALLCQAGLIVQPCAADGFERVERPTRGGGSTMVTTLLVTYRIINAEDGAFTETKLYSDGEDPSDKGFYKAYTGGMKYFLLNQFLVPTTELPDPEKTGSQGVGERHEPAKPAAPAQQRAPRQQRPARAATANAPREAPGNAPAEASNAPPAAQAAQVAPQAKADGTGVLLSPQELRSTRIEIMARYIVLSDADRVTLTERDGTRLKGVGELWDDSATPHLRLVNARQWLQACCAAVKQEPTMQDFEEAEALEGKKNRVPHLREREPGEEG